jgi:hypothetical protein
VKSSEAGIRSRVHSIPDLAFEDGRLTSYAGLVVFQKLFSELALRDRLRRSLAGCVDGGLYGLRTIFFVLVVHLLLGHRQLREMAYCKDDPIVLRVLGLRRLPDVATVSRTLSSATPRAEAQVAALTRELVLDGLEEHSSSRVTLDFDGMVISTRRGAEGTAVGFKHEAEGDAKLSWFSGNMTPSHG